MTSKYGKLTEHLQQSCADKREVTITFRRLESILGFELPKSAVDYRQWWANQSDINNRSQAKAWNTAGFKVDSVKLKKLGGWVRFHRV